MDHNPLEKVRLEDLPANVRISIPAKDSAHIVIAVIGYIIVAIGLGLIVFGPDEIRYNIVTGMTFTQMLQAYPGPIATAGGLIVALSNHVAKSEEKEQMESKLIAVEKAIQIEDEEVPEGHRMSLTWLDDVTFKLELVEKDNASEEAVAS